MTSENERLSKIVSDLPSREESAQLLKEFKTKLIECDQSQKIVNQQKTEIENLNKELCRTYQILDNEMNKNNELEIQINKLQ